MTDFNQKVVLITGGSSGIGFALAAEFLHEKAIVVIAGRNEVKLQEAVARLQLSGQMVTGIAADVSLETDCQELIDKTVKQFGRLDILVNNAGVSMRAMFRDLDLVVLKRLFDTNFWGAVYCTKYALPHILESGGSIVSISSIAGIRALPGRTGYSSSKAALQSFMESLRVELLKTNVHVLMVYPGYTASNIRNVALAHDGTSQAENPLDESKLMPAETVAIETLKAINSRKRDLILTTQGKMTVLLNKFFPKLMDTIVYNFMKREGDLK